MRDKNHKMTLLIHSVIIGICFTALPMTFADGWPGWGILGFLTWLVMFGWWIPLVLFHKEEKSPCTETE